MIKTVLSIEDDSSTQFLNRLFLEESGYCKNMLEAADGLEALAFFERLENGEEPKENMPQLILLDINMPLMGGWEFLDIYTKKYPKFAESIPVFILSSTINPADRIKVHNDIRVVSLLEKPFDFEQIEVVKRFLGVISTSLP